jgi:Flp pilus assembly protein TadG
MKLHRHRASPSRNAGQSLVEFALALPLLFLIVFGLIDLGAFVFADSVMSQASREGARVASTEASRIGNTTDPSCNQPGGPVCPTAAAFVTHVSTAVSNASSGLTSAVTVYVRCDPAGSPPTGDWTTGSCGSNNTPGNLVSVRLVYSFNPITPVGRTAVGTIARSGSATMVIN